MRTDTGAQFPFDIAVVSRVAYRRLWGIAAAKLEPKIEAGPERLDDGDHLWGWVKMIGR